MQTMVNLKLQSKEVESLFVRKIANGDQFLELVILKIGLIISSCLQGKVEALLMMYDLRENLLTELDFVSDEIDKYDGLLSKRMSSNYNIEYLSPYEGKIACSNEISFNLVELITQYDILFSKVKHFFFMGGFESKQSFYSLRSKYQKRLNKLLSNIISLNAKNASKTSIDEFIENSDNQGCQDVTKLILAINSTYSPGYNQHVRNQKVLRLKNLLKKEVSAA